MKTGIHNDCRYKNKKTFQICKEQSYQTFLMDIRFCPLTFHFGRLN